MDDDAIPDDLPPELRPESPEDYERRRRTMWFGIGAPTVIGAVLAMALGVPWWVVAVVVVGVGLGIFFST
jgi:hypothetical protein